MARRRPAQARARRPTLILDAGAVIALARADHRARAFVLRAQELGAEVVVPPVVVAETVRGDGPRDAAVNRVLKAVGEVPSTTETTARVAGALLGVAKSNATVDALVVAEAVGRAGAQILTADARDLGNLAAGRPEVRVHAL